MEEAAGSRAHVGPLYLRDAWDPSFQIPPGTHVAPASRTVSSGGPSCFTNQPELLYTLLGRAGVEEAAGRHVGPPAARTVQGYLAHKKTRAPLGAPYGTRHVLL